MTIEQLQEQHISQLADLAAKLNVELDEFAAQEAIRELNDIQDEYLDEDLYLTEDHPDYCPNYHIMQLIDQVTVATLTNEGKLSAESVDTLVKLEHIRTSRLTNYED